MDDDVAERGRPVRLLLARRAAARHWAIVQAVLTIHDDDTPPVVDPVYTVYADRHGAGGRGLVIEIRSPAPISRPRSMARGPWDTRITRA